MSSISALLYLITHIMTTVIGTFVNGVQPHIVTKDDKHVLTIDINTCGPDFVIDSDYVSYTVTTTNNTVSHTVQVLNRYHKRIPGVLHTESGTVFGFGKKGKPKKLFSAYDPCIGNFAVAVDPKHKLNRETYVVVEFQIKQPFDQYPTAALCQIIGTVGDIEAERKYLETICTCNWKGDARMLKMIEEVSPDNCQVTDCRNLTVFSIDPQGCKDVDDAIHFISKNDGYEIGIHIADVTQQFQSGTALDAELQSRLQSVYLPHTQVNMFSKVWSENKLSLLAGQDRHTIAIIIQVNKQHEIISHKIERCIVRNRHNYTYDQIDKIFADNSDETIVAIYNIVKQLASIQNFDSHKLVEYLMVEANSYVAKHLATTTDISLLRCHPASPKIANVPTNVSRMINAHMSKAASYITYHKGDTLDPTHHGLYRTYYTHFSSPIRRYADNLVHRSIFNPELLSKMDQNLLANLVFRMNKTNSLYNRIERRADTLEKLNKLQTLNRTDVKADIISIGDNELLLYIEEYDIQVRSKLVHDKLLNTHEIQYHDTDNIITVASVLSHQTDNIVTYKLGEKIDIKISITFNNVQKVNICCNHIGAQ